jgi:hypothetical protein
VGVSIEGTFEFETLDDQAPPDETGAHTAWHDGVPITNREKRWLELYQKHDEAWRELLPKRVSRSKRKRTPQLCGTIEACASCSKPVAPNISQPTELQEGVRCLPTLLRSLVSRRNCYAGGRAVGLPRGCAARYRPYRFCRKPSSTSLSKPVVVPGSNGRSSPAVAELTRSPVIQLNERVSLRGLAKAIP